MKRLVLLGGGHAHVEVLRRLAEDPGARPEVTVVTPFPRLIYSGMVPGVIAGHYRLDECAIGIEALEGCLWPWGLQVCGLTGQLFVRVSPIAAADSSCAAQGSR